VKFQLVHFRRTDELTPTTLQVYEANISGPHVMLLQLSFYSILGPVWHYLCDFTLLCSFVGDEVCDEPSVVVFVLGIHGRQLRVVITANLISGRPQ
jgi:hypothetical protein